MVVDLSPAVQYIVQPMDAVDGEQSKPGKFNSPDPATVSGAEKSFKVFGQKLRRFLLKLRSSWAKASKFFDKASKFLDKSFKVI